MLPATVTRFFWDTPSKSIDPQRHKGYVISRILELGDPAAVAWLERQYSKEDIQRVVARSKVLSPKSRSYWSLKYRIPIHA